MSFGWPGAVAHSEVKLFQKAFLKIARQPSTGFVIVFVFVISSVFTFVLVFVFVFGWSGTVAHLEAKLPSKHFSKPFAGQTSAPEFHNKKRLIIFNVVHIKCNALVLFF